MEIEGKKVLRKYDVQETSILANYLAEVAIVASHQDFGGVMVYATFKNCRGEWIANAGERVAMRCLLEEVEALRAERDRYYDFILGLRVLLENGETAHSFDHSAFHMMLCDVLEPAKKAKAAT